MAWVKFWPYKRRQVEDYLMEVTYSGIDEDFKQEIIKSLNAEGYRHVYTARNIDTQSTLLLFVKLANV